MYDNLYAKITDEETSKSLWDLYWRNPVTQTPEPFVAREQVTNGRKMKGTYCPEHLHLYHLLCKWEAEADKDHHKTKTGLKEMMKKGVSTVAVPISIVKKKDNTPELLKKYEPFFMQLEKDSINDVTMIVFDLRLFQKEMGNMSPTLSDAISQLGIMQSPLPSVAQTMNTLPQGNTNGVINQEGLPQTEQGAFTQ